MARSGLLRMFLLGGLGFLAVGGVAVLSGTEGGRIAGGTFLIIGGCWAGVAVLVGGYYNRVARKQAADRHLFDTGSRAVGVIETVEQTSMSINDMPVFDLTVRIDVEGDSFVHERRLVTPTSAVPVPGQVVNVAYDPRNRSRVAYETKPGLAALPAEILAVRNAPAGDDRLAQLERLGRLRDDGVLTEDEFQAQKARLLEG